MDIGLEDMSEDEITDYIIQMSIQESSSVVCLLSSCNANGFFVGEITGLRELLKFPSAFRETDIRGWLPLHRAAVQPMAEVLETVLKAYSDDDLEKRTADGETCLTLATQAGLLENVRTLLNCGASPQNPNSTNQSPLLLAVRAGSYEMTRAMLTCGALVNQVCLKKWSAMHEAAKLGHSDIMMLLLRYGGQVTVKGQHGVTPLGTAAEHGREEILQILIQSGADVNAQANNGDSVMMDAAGSGNPDCVKLLLENAADPNLASRTGHLPLHRAAYEGHYLVLQTLVAVTSKKALRLSGQSPVHSAADGGHAHCLKLLIDSGFDVNSPLSAAISENYSDMRRSALYFAVSNGDVTCTEMLLNAGAKPDLDPLRCLLVAVRAGRYEIVKMLLAKQADVNCYFTVVSDTVFPTALQYCLRDEVMMRLLLNSGYQADLCFLCKHDTSCCQNNLPKRVCQTYSDGDKMPFCEFIGLSCLVHLSGMVVRILLDYVSHVELCSNLRPILEKRMEWSDIFHILSNPRPLKHLCRLQVRRIMTLSRLGDMKIMGSFPPRLKNYLLYKECDLYGHNTEWPM
uniref:SOCS box domain-containing protein n=1 Tax=Denticeps clupeoides TaxID=299321 RepID=A0AAY4BCK1_9TELE